MLASNKDIFLAPAMNVRMWEHPSTKENLNKLKNFGYKIIGPETGDMACGEFGEGKMTEPNEIIKQIEDYFINLNQNKKLKALVTAGPTREYIDPVRFITNKSSGKQGFELARSLSNKGFETTLISGPTNLKANKNINFIKVETADQMFKATQNSLPTDVAIFSAAVADFKIKKKNEKKMKKEDYINLNLEKNIDIINYVSNHNSLRPKLVIGFAAETNDIIKNAKKKLMEKNCDWIIANDVSNKSIGFNSDFNEVSIFYKNKKINDEKLVMKKKSKISDEIIERVISQLN
jgi:phosphopantothenoylcysteine decarboxylase/phosphopantothenate--cysteine ligase